MFKFKLYIAVILLASIIVSQKVQANQRLSDRALAQYISSQIQSSLDEKPAKKVTYCDDLGCAVVVQ